MLTAGFLMTAAALLAVGTTSPARVRLAALTATDRLGGSRGSLSVRRRRAGVPAFGVPAVGAPVLAIASALAVAAVAGVAAMVVAVVVGGGGVVAARDRSARRRQDRRAAQAATALHIVLGELEAGGGSGDALAAAAAAAPDLAGALSRASDAARVGDNVGAPLLRDPELRAVGVAWSAAGDSGTALVDVLSRVAADFAERRDQRRAVQVALSGPWSSAVMLAALPVVGIVMGMAMGARPLAFLAGSPVGQAVCCAGVLLDAAGLLWLRHIVASAARP